MSITACEGENACSFINTAESSNVQYG